MIDRLKKAMSPAGVTGDLHKPGVMAAFAAKIIFKGIVLAIFASVAMLFLSGGLGLLPFPLSGAIVYSVVLCWFVGGVVFYAMWLPLGRYLIRLSASNARFERLSRIDPLSGLLNRRGFNDTFERAGEGAFLAIFDIDYFKAINDRFGHAAGDAVISEVAQRFRTVFGSGCCIARLGGEEFAVIVDNTDHDTGMMMVESLRERISAFPVRFQDHEIHVTISAGVADFSGGRSNQHVYTAADRTLYVAKSAGRNRVLHERDLPVFPGVADGSPMDAVIAPDMYFPFGGAEKSADAVMAKAS